MKGMSHSQSPARVGLAIVVFAGCGSGSPAQPVCTEPARSGAPCCDASLYVEATVPELAIDPGRYANARVDVLGIADWYHGAENSCTCAGGLCTCPTPLSLRSAACGTSVRLAGQFRGRAVECADTGCWPFVPLGQYVVCGVWQFSASGPFGPQGELQLSTYCER